VIGTKASAGMAAPATMAVRSGPRVDIIGIGVQKAATSWLFRCMLEHPWIRGAAAEKGVNKELHFFNHEYERGYTWYHRGFEFGPWKSMEFSTLYFHDRNVPERIKRYNADAKLILALRNPVDRAVSHHRHEIRRGRLTPELYRFWSAAEQNPSYLEQGFYGRHLSRWLEHFDREQIHIVLYEDVRAEPLDVITRAQSFVGVDPSFRPSRLTERINIAVVPRYERLESAMRWSSRTGRRLLGDRVVRGLGRTGLPALIRQRNRVELGDEHVPPLTEEERARLKAVFADDIARLEAILGRSLAAWS
jgi:hypothetical protein